LKKKIVFIKEVKEGKKMALASFFLLLRASVASVVPYDVTFVFG